MSFSFIVGDRELAMSQQEGSWLLARDPSCVFIELNERWETAYVDLELLCSSNKVLFILDITRYNLFIELNLYIFLFL